MSFENMKKAELVSVARTLEQELKIIKRKNTDENNSADNLPFHGISYVRENGKFYLVKLKFDTESKVAKIASIEEDERNSMQMVEFHAKKFLAETISPQNRRDK